MKLINTSRHTQCKFFQHGFIMPTLIEEKVGNADLTVGML